MKIFSRTIPLYLQEGDIILDISQPAQLFALLTKL